MTSNILAILTNSRAADQRSMVGYGQILLDAARQTECVAVELRAASLIGQLLPRSVSGTVRKLANNLDRFVITPLSLLGTRVDTVHVVDPGNVVYLPLLRYRRSIVTVHDMIPYLARDGKLKGWQPTAMGRWLMRRICAQLAKVDHIVCVSHSTRKDLLTYVDIPPERVSVIHNAVFQPMKPATPEACISLRARLSIPESAKVVVHVGRNWYKNREAVLTVAAELRKTQPDLRLVMVGALTSNLKAQATALGLENTLHVLNRVETADMATLYTTADLLFFPSYYEGFGLPVLEARMCGTPVVCSDGGALPEVIGSRDRVVKLSSSDFITQVSEALDEHRGEPDCTLLQPFSAKVWFKCHAELYGTSA